MFQKGKSKSLFYRWLLSYVSILLFPLLISGMVSLLSIQLLTQETNAAIHSTLSQMRRQIDEKVKSFQEVALQISMNTDLKSIISAGTRLTNAQQYGVYSLREQISKLIQAYPSINNIYIYHRATDSILAREGRMSTRYAHQRYFAYESLGYEDFMALIQEEHGTDYIVLGKGPGEDSTTGTLTLLRSLPYARINTAPLQGALILTIPLEIIQATLSDLRWVDQFQLLVFDDKGQILLSNGPRHIPEEGIEAYLSGEPGSLDRAYDISILSSGETDWQYVVVMPVDALWQKTGTIRMVTLVSVLFCIVVGGLVAYAFARRNYDPLDKMVLALTEKKTLAAKKKEGQYSFVFDAINKNLQEMRLTYNRLEQQDRELRSIALQHHLKGLPEVEGTRVERLDCFDGDAVGPLHCVLLFSIENYDAFLSSAEEEGRTAAFKLAIFALSNVLEELIASQGSHCVATEMDGILACVVSFRNPDIAENLYMLDQAIESCQAFVLEQLMIRAVVAVSNLHGDRSKIHEAYQEALTALEYQRVAGGGPVTKYERIENRKYSYDYSPHMESMLANYIKTGDLEQAGSLVDQAIQSNLGGAVLSNEMTRCLMFDIISTVVKAVYEICDIHFIESVQPLKRLLASGSITEMRSELRRALELVCQYVTANKKEHHQLSNAVIEFIHANYADPNLSVSAISSKFGLTRSYLSTLFKAQTGQTLLDCINRSRIENAKILLRDSDSSIHEISVGTGFSGSVAFIKTFKKYEGITPGSYRKIASLEDPR